MKLRLLQLAIVATTATILTFGFIAGRLSVATCPDPVSVHAAFEEGQRDMTAYVEDCTLERARAGECVIPCSSESDCVAKNGTKDNY